MDNDYLVLDMGYLVKREFHATAQHDPRLAVLYAFSRFQEYKSRFGTSRFVFTFDSQPYHRMSCYKDYKAHRQQKYDAMSDEDKTLQGQLRSLLGSLCSTYLPDFLNTSTNVLACAGYEADDVMAVVAKSMGNGDRCILVSEDCDLYQLLTASCAVYHPRKKVLVTAKSFREQWGCPPNWWKGAKAIAGDVSDDIPGVYGVGIKTAIMYMKHGGLGDREKEAEIRKWINTEDYQRNVKLVSLPYQHCPGIWDHDELMLDDTPVDLKALVDYISRALGVSLDDRRKRIRSGC